MVEKQELIEALRVRYDAYSAETVFEMARARAELGDKTSFDGTELAAFRAALAAVGDRIGGVLARIDDMLTAVPAPAPVPAKKVELVETTIVLSGVEAADGEQVLARDADARARRGDRVQVPAAD
jgi:hypothetical protein